MLYRIYMDIYIERLGKAPDGVDSYLSKSGGSDVRVWVNPIHMI